MSSNQAKVILGIDPGTIITGYGIIRNEEGKYEALDYGCIKPPAQSKLTDRYLVIFNGIEELIQKYQPEILVVETQYVSKNVQSAIKLGMARGIAIIAAKRHQLAVYEYAPSEAKKAVVGTGKASKEQVQNMVKILLKLAEPPQPEDAADALALAICHANSLTYKALSGIEI